MKFGEAFAHFMAATPVRRADWTRFIVVEHNGMNPQAKFEGTEEYYVFNIPDLTSGDWEIKEEVISASRSQIKAAWDAVFSTQIQAQMTELAFNDFMAKLPKKLKANS